MTTTYETDLQKELGIDDVFETLDNDAKAKHLGLKYGFLTKLTAENILKMSWIIHKAAKSKELWPKVRYECQLAYPRDKSKIKKLRVIGSAYEKLMKYADHLPPHWSVLYQIARLPDDALDQLVKRGHLYKGATFKNIELGIVQKQDPNKIRKTLKQENSYKHEDLYVPIKLRKALPKGAMGEISTLLGYLADRDYITFESYVEFIYLPESIRVFERIIEKMKLEQTASAPTVCTKTQKCEIDTTFSLQN